MNEGKLYNQIIPVEQTSVIECIERLCALQLKTQKSTDDFDYVTQRILKKKNLNFLKKVAFSALIHSHQASSPENSPRSLLQSGWDETAVTSAVAYQIRTQFRRYHDANKLENLAKEYLQDGDNSAALLKLILCLSDPKLPSEIGNGDSRYHIPNRFEIEQLSKLKGPVQVGDYPYKIYHSTYTLRDGIETSDSTLPAMYGHQHPKPYKHPNAVGCRKKTSLSGLNSEIFKIKGLTGSSYEFDSQTRLYGGLRHSKTSTLDITMSYPQLNGPINLLSSLSTSNTSVDEGFVSPSNGEDFFSDSGSELSLDSASLTEEKPIIPYHDYKFPDYDLHVWEKCLKITRSNCRSWETFGQPAGATEVKLHLTEAGAEIFDEVWQHRACIIQKLTNFFNGVLTFPVWKKVDESVLLKHALLVMMGVASETFQFNSLGQMFLPVRGIYISGVDPEALHSILSCFGEWGTCYWRLLKMCTAEFTFQRSIFNQNKDDRGIVFKAFISGLQKYLHEYMRWILHYDLNGFTLHKLLYSLRKSGAQIRYICQLCRCGAPDMPALSPGVSKDFPTGVALLSYLYEEAVHCPEPNHCLALMYLLRRSCLPYLQFISDWIFRGRFWDARGEFMLKINDDLGGSRKDRQRWLKYVETTHPDPGSCMPSFFAPMADDIYTCGKTVSLLFMICPEHFLGVDGMNAPDLEISFSKRRIRETEGKWIKHNRNMIEMEKRKAKHWAIHEEELVTAARITASSARQAAEEEIVQMKQVLRLEHEERDKIKRKEFARLKKQAEKDAERRARLKREEMGADIRREADRKMEEEKENMEKKSMLQEEKENLISYYDNLKMEAERRIEKATWKTNRRKLHEERIKFLIQHEKFWASKMASSEQLPTIEVEPASSSSSESIALNVQKEELVSGSSSEDCILEEFVNRTISSQIEVVKSSPMKDDSDLEAALAAVRGGTEESDGINNERIPALSQLITGTNQSDGKIDSRNVTQMNSPNRHASDESSEVTSTRQGKKLVPGHNISDASVFAEAAQISTQQHLRMGSNTQMNSQNRQASDESSEVTSTRQGKKLVPGHNVSDASVFADTTEPSTQPPFKMVGKTPTNLPYRHASDQSSEVTSITQGKKLVPGYNVSDASVFGYTTEAPMQPHSRMVGNKRICDSSVFSHLTRDREACKTNEDSHPKSQRDEMHGSHIETKAKPRQEDMNLTHYKSASISCGSGRRVAGVHVSDSSVFDLFHPSTNGHVGATEEAPDRNHSAATVQALLYGREENPQPPRYSKKLVPGCNVSTSTLLMGKNHPQRIPIVENNQDQDLHSNLVNKILGYSTSLVPCILPSEQQKKSCISSLAINRPKFHPSYSTVQLLLRHEDLTAVDMEEDCLISEKTFHLQLPPISAYSDDLRRNLCQKKQISSDLRDVEPVDLVCSLLTRSFRNEDEEEEDTLDEIHWKSDIDLIDTHALPVVLSQCVLHPVLNQVALANRCVVNYFMVDLMLPRHFEMLRHFFFMEDGEFGHILSTQLFEKIHSGCKPIELLNPVALGSLVSRAVQESAQQNSPHADRLHFAVQHLPAVLSTNDPCSLECFSLKYDIDWPCNIVITESNEKKYSQVFGFLLKLKHVMWVLNDVRTRLSIAATGTSWLLRSDLHRLHLYQHEMSNFVKVMQGYVSTQVVHVCWHEFQGSLKFVTCLEDLHKVHVEYLQKCVFRCLLTKKTISVMNVITDVLKTILRFWTQLSTKTVSFRQLENTYMNFKKYSTFLFKVVSKLVERGYQPHLEDFLILLNYNGFYK